MDTLARTTNRISIAIALPPAAVAWSMTTPAAMASPRFFGLSAESRTPNPSALTGREAVDRLHPCRHRGVLARLRAALPLLHAEGDRAEAEEQDHDVAERRAAGLVGRAGGIAQAEHEQRHERDPGHPADEERRAVDPRLGREQHQDAGDDRDRADRDPDREREQAAERAGEHGRPPSVVRGVLPDAGRREHPARADGVEGSGPDPAGQPRRRSGSPGRSAAGSGTGRRPRSGTPGRGTGRSPRSAAGTGP